MKFVEKVSKTRSLSIINHDLQVLFREIDEQSCEVEIRRSEKADDRDGR